MLSLFVALLLFTTAHANLNRSHLRLKRLGHTSNHAVPHTSRAERFQRRDDPNDGLLGGLAHLINGGTGDPSGSNSDDIFGSPSDSGDGFASSLSSPTQTPTIPGIGDSSASSNDATPPAGGTAPPATITRTDPVASSSSTLSSTSTPTPTSSSDGGFLGGIPPILSSVGNGLGGGLSGILGESSSPVPSPSPSTHPQQPNPPQSVPTSNTGGLSVLPTGSDSSTPGPSPAPSSSSEIVILPDPTTDAPSPTSGSDSSPESPSPSSTNSGVLGLPPIIPTLLPPLSDSSSSPSGTSSGVTIIPNPTTAPPSQSGTASSTSSDDGGILPTILPTISIPIGPSSTDNSANPTSSDSSSPTLTIIPTSVSITVLPTGPSNTTSDVGTPTSVSTPTNTSIESTSTGNASSIFSVPTSLFPSTSLTEPTSLSTVTPSSSTDDELSSQFSFVTASSIETFSAPTTSLSPTETDPDAAPSTTSVDFPDPQSQTASPTRPVIPSSLPTRIFGALSVDPDTDQEELQGKTLVSLLFKSALNWNFINKNVQTVGQIFGFFPGVLTSALGVTDADVKTYALQVQVPLDWAGDVNQLGTMFLGYIPSDQVENLASLLRAPNSQFYNQPTDTGKQLASLVVPAFSLLSVSNSDVTGSGPSGSSNGSKSNGSSKTRTDAIIGVCSAVGGVAALVGLWWVLRYVQRRQAAKHRRLSNLSDPNVSNGVYGTQHDDRRTSFFYAEDELRGGYSPDAMVAGTAQQQQQQQQQQHLAEGSVMQQRTRPVVQHTPISAPVLQQSSLNW